jgi:hypothetical protein
MTERVSKGESEPLSLDRSSEWGSNFIGSEIGEISGLTRERSKSVNSTEEVAKTVAAFGSVVIGWLAPLDRCIEEQTAITTETENEQKTTN